MNNKLSPNIILSCSSCNDLNLNMNTNIEVSLPETSMRITTLKGKPKKSNYKKNTLF